MAYNRDDSRPIPPPKSARYSNDIAVDTVQLPVYTEKYDYEATPTDLLEGIDAPQVMTDKDWEDLEASRERQRQMTFTQSEPDGQSPGGYDVTQPMTTERGLETQKQVKERKQILGLQRRYFILLLIGLPLLVIIGSIAGAAASLNAQVMASKTGFAVAGMFIRNASAFNMHFFYQDPVSFSIHRRISLDVSSYQPQQSFRLTRVPTGPVPMAAAAYVNSAETGFLNLFYITNSSIAFANISCTASNYNSCATLSNTILPNLRFPVASDSSIAVIHLGLSPTQGLRLFYHNADHQVTVLSHMNGAWDTGIVIGSVAVPGSGLACASFNNAGSFSVLYVDQERETLQTIQFVQTWGPPTILTAQRIPNFTPKTQVALAYAFKFDQLFAYYTGSDRKVYGFEGRNVSQSDFVGSLSSGTSGVRSPGWIHLPQQQTSWTTSMSPGAGIAALGISDNVRFYQASQDGYVQTKGVMGTNDFAVQII